MINPDRKKLSWMKGVLESRTQAASNLLSLRFRLPPEEYINHAAGQHYDLRLTAAGDYVAERSYSIANAPNEGTVVEFGIQLIPDGEVSPYLWSIKEGAVIEMRGPIGGHFIWDVNRSETLILVGGGSGTVPLMAMIRHYVQSRRSPNSTIRCSKIFMIISAKSFDTIPYYMELQKYTQEFPEITLAVTITQDAPEDWKGYTRRVDASLVKSILGDTIHTNALIYTCGRNGFVDAAATALIACGYSPEVIMTERFG